MKFNPVSKKLFTDDGEFIKKLYCPYQLKWDLLKLLPDQRSRLCSLCEKPVIDTNHYDEAHLKRLLEERPDTCLKIDLNQNNIHVVNIYEQK